MLGGVNRCVDFGMSFRKWHRRVYVIWVVISVLVVLSMLVLLVAPLAYY
jgi:hypothetical protein